MKNIARMKTMMIAPILIVIKFAINVPNLILNRGAVKHPGGHEDYD